MPLIAALPRLSGAERAVVVRLMATNEPSDAQVAEVIRLVDAAGGLEYARHRAETLSQRAEAELAALPASTAREALRDSIAYAVERRS